MADNKKKSVLGLDSQVTTLSIKCYVDQMPHGWKSVQKKIKNFPKQNASIVAIKHDKDTYYEDFWKPACEKEHYHIVFIMKDREKDGSGRVKRIRIRNILDALDIEYRKECDANLLKQHGIETVHNVPNLVTYLTHDTEQAILDGKYQYKLYDLVSNLDMAEIEAIRAEYLAPKVTRQRAMVTKKEMAEYDEVAWQLGLARHDFYEWVDTLPFGVRDNNSMSTIEKRYQRGLENNIYNNGTQMTRCCIFVQGEPNTGKTYASSQATRNLGLQTLQIEESGTGKLDNLKASTDAIIVDDATLPNLLNMSDNKICRAYRRHASNPYWCGQYLIVTSNLSFDNWLNDCHIYTPQHRDALTSRFFICRLERTDSGQSQLYCTSVSNRGTQESFQKRKELYTKFALEFNNIIKHYVPKSTDNTDLVEEINAMVCPDITEEYLAQKDPNYEDNLAKTYTEKKEAFNNIVYQLHKLCFEKMELLNEIKYEDEKEIPIDTEWNGSQFLEKVERQILTLDSKEKIIDMVLSENRYCLTYYDYVHKKNINIKSAEIKKNCKELIEQYLELPYAKYIYTYKDGNIRSDYSNHEWVFF